MQQLQFEASWDKALANQDRQNIENIFNETKHLKQASLSFSPIKEAINHQESLLVTVLIHNFTDEPYMFMNTKLLYRVQGDVVADNVFNLPILTIPSEVSMPWTFIFPKGTYKPQSSYQNGRLEVL
ncbi:MAG TPA: SLAP domain-containing protein [Ureibacillus sp.]|nr:SLAP domain-containing protein [Ureibacillus sp.]